MKSYVALLAGLLSLSVMGCEARVVENDGEPADVDVIDTDDAPAPAVDGPDVNISSEKTEVDAPDVDVDADAPADAATPGGQAPGV